MKKALLLALVLIITLVVAACRSDDAPATPATPEPDAPGAQATPAPAPDEDPAEPTPFELLSAIEEGATLRFAWWGTQTRHDMTMEIIDIFEALSGISIEFEFYGWGDYHTTMMVQAAAGMLPCVMQQTHGELNNFVPTGLTMALDPWIDVGILDLSDYDPGLLRWGQWEGRQYFVPTGLGFQAMLVNMDLVEAAGVEITIPFTYEEMLQWGVQIYNATGAWTQDWFGLVFTEFTFFGTPMFDENGDWNIPEEEIIYTFGNMRRAEELGLRWPPGDPRDAVEESHFATREAWNRPSPINATAGFFAVLGDDANLKFVPGPVRPGARPHTFEATMNWAVTTQTDYPNAAVFLMDQLLHNEEIMMIMQVDRGMPGSARVRDFLEPYFNPVARLMNQAIETMIAGGTLTDQEIRLAPAWRPAVQSIVSDHMEMIHYTDLPVEEIAASLVREAQQTIDRSR